MSKNIPQYYTLFRQFNILLKFPSPSNSVVEAFSTPILQEL